SSIAVPNHKLALTALSFVTSAAVWAFRRNQQLRAVLNAQSGNLAETQEALAHSARFHEERFAELTEAKAEVELKVEERTTEIREVNQKLASTLDEVRSLEQAE